MDKNFFLLAAVLVVLLGRPAVAATLEEVIDNPLPAPVNIMSLPNIFAYPGKSCPGGSDPYPGPEQALAAESGAIYCRFFRRFVIMPGEEGKTKCPAGMKDYHDAKAKPEKGQMWCEMEPVAKSKPND